MKRADFESLVTKIIGLSSADDVTIRMSHKVENTTRFGESRITQNVSREVSRLTVKTAFGSRKASSETTDLTEAGIRKAVRRAEGMAKHTNEDPE